MLVDFVCVVSQFAIPQSNLFGLKHVDQSSVESLVNLFEKIEIELNVNKLDESCS